MKNINKLTIIIAISTLAIGMGLGWLLFGGRSSDDHSHEVAMNSQKQVWTCSMHPSVRQNEPGKCPLCGMDLIPLETDPGAENPFEIKMSSAAIKLANIQTSVIGTQVPVKKIMLYGKVQTNEKNVYTQTSHFAGRIEELKVSITGEYVKKDQLIAYVYSPELVSAQEELFEAYKIRNSQPDLYNAARKKLINWKLSEQQIDDILEKGKLRERFPITSNVSGIVMKKTVNLGDYVQRGSALYEIADLSRLWILFDVYESEMPWIKTGSEIEYTIQSLPGESFIGKIDFIDPVINPRTRVARARISILNKNSKLKPEMFASGVIKSAIENKGESLIIPKSAVMWTGKRSVVYVKTSADAGVAFEMREVILGPSLGNSYLIEKGLKPGEEIATNGTFSIDAAAQLSGKPSMMAREGGAVMTGHQHGSNRQTNDNKVHQAATLSEIPISEQAKESITELLESYLLLKDALVTDDFNAAISKAQNFQDVLGGISMALFEEDAHQIWMKEGMPLGAHIKKMIEAGDIGKARIPFKPLSKHMIVLAQVFQPIKKPLYIQHCPMADDFKGADWLSTEENIMNPYYGASMLTCGEVTDTIKSKNRSTEQKVNNIKSPHVTAMANIGDNHVHIDYSSPRVRSRQIFGGLVAYDQVWSTGAHSATSITISKDVRIENKPIQAGKYALFTIPGRDEWTIILNKNWDQHLADEYSQNEDILRFNVNPKISKEIQEDLVFKIESIDHNKGKIHFKWEKVSFSFNLINN